MSKSSIGVAVIGAGMAGRAHTAGYRSASTVYDSGLPEIRLVAISDLNRHFASETARRFGYQRAEADWKAIVAAPDIDVVSIVVANTLHREILEALLAAGKHVLCEKPLAPSIADGEAMAAAAKAAKTESAVGFTFRRSPAVAAIREQIHADAVGRPLHFNGHYWCDYACNSNGPMSWRYKGGAGSGALADIGSHLIDLAEFVCGPIRSIRGAVLSTFIKQRALPLGEAVGHAAAALSDKREPVENEDLVTFTAQFKSGATRHVLGLARRLRPAEFAGLRGLLREGRGDVRSRPRWRVQDHRRRPEGHGQRLPSGAHRTVAPLSDGRHGDGLPGRELRAERPLRVPGARVPRTGRGPRSPSPLPAD